MYGRERINQHSRPIWLIWCCPMRANPLPIVRSSWTWSRCPHSK